jgi:uncharacterized membrane protein YczE
VENFKKFIQGMYQKEHFVKRLILVVIAVITMGFSLSWLVLVDMGTDPCTSLNLAVASKLGLSLGTWQATFNCMLFIIVLIWGRHMIGFGTLANMFLVGYSVDFFSWLWSRVLPEGLFTSWTVRICVLIPALAVFILAVAVYIDVQLGTSPYDAIPDILYRHQKRFSYRLLRCFYDIAVTIIAFFLGAKIGIVTIVMGFTLGPVISLVGKWISPFLGTEEVV